MSLRCFDQARQLVSGIKFKFHGFRRFGAGGIELPFFHCIDCRRHKNRVTTDYFGVLHVAIGQNRDLEPDDAGEGHLARDVWIFRIHLAAYFSLSVVLGKSVDWEKSDGEKAKHQ